ncbi:serine hydrolase [Paenibacillus sp. Marseille-Q4541]|uniref:serine hydrolase domain-containing protein n=1 Tax=Paenibacillus sp. Marseille-Q4541 TaxID=2831522 RepID=UPI001BAB6C4A|nr:serine hydrolase [Paenibacillus sp. Marseille-Q4541]
MKNVVQRISAIQEQIHFSGSVYVKQKGSVVAELSYGYANRSEKIKNGPNTRFGIASGCKIFTSIAIAQLVERGTLSFTNKLTECLDITFPEFDKGITLHHLLTHTSGVPDYFDEEVMDDFEQLWVSLPMYHIRQLRDFLPLFQNEPMKSTPGERFHYNNAGYILLGLVVEQASGLCFSDYVQTYIFNPAGMMDSGYFEMDALPERTALGYIDAEDGSSRTNIYSLPAKGGSDGGAYTTAADMVRLWESLTGYHLLNQELTNLMLLPHADVSEGTYYGYGVWIRAYEEDKYKFVLMGYDPGVNFRAAFYPDRSLYIVVCSNQSAGAFDIISEIEDELT